MISTKLSCAALSSLVAFGALSALGCDALSKHDGADAAVVVVVPAATTAAPTAAPTDPAAAPPVTGAAPLGAAAPVAPGVHPVAVTDGGKAVAVTDAGAVTDGGKAVPTPTPTFTIPTAIPGFDAGGFKPPAGFPTAIPTTLPTFPPPAKQ